MDEFYRLAIITLRGMWNYRWIGLATVWVVGVVTFIAVTLTPERYEASARIFVNTDSILKPLMTGLTVQPNEDQRIVMLSRVVISRPNVDRLIRETGLDQKAVTSQQRESLIDSVMKRLTFRGIGRENLYTLTFRDVNPERAKQAIEMLANMFIEQSKGGKSEDTATAKRFIDEQIAVYEQKLQEAESRLKEFRTENLGMSPGEGRSDYFARMSEAELRLNQARLELLEAERGRDALRRGLAGAEAGESTGGPGAGAIALAELDGRIDTMRKTLDSHLLKFTEDHPDVQSTRRGLQELEAQRRAMAANLKGIAPSAAAAAPVAPAPGSMASGPRAADQLRVSLAQSEAAVASLSARVAEFSARHEKLKASATLVPKLEAELAQLNRDYDVNKRNYETLVARRESASISGEMQTVAGVSDFRLVDPPRVSPGPVFPNHAALFPLALLFSLAAGLVAAYVAREVRPSFYDGRALREKTGLPLLGVVSMHLNEPRRRETRRGAFRFLGGLGAFVGVFIAGATALQLAARNLI